MWVRNLREVFALQRPSGYKTRQLEVITGFLQRNRGRHLTAGEIEQGLHQEGTPIGTATIYRHLQKLEQKGVVRQYSGEKGKGASYEYQPSRGDCDSHFHLKCELCGGFRHLDCMQMESFQAHVLEEHGFQVNHSKTILYGVCEACSKAEENSPKEVKN